MTNSMMLPSVARPAQSKQIVQRIVSLVFWCRDAFAINVMNVQIVLATAVLAGMVVALQSGFSASPEIVIVSSLFCVLFFALRIKNKPTVDAFKFFGLLALWASVLRAGLVFKVFSAVRAHQDRANRRSTSRNAKRPQMLSVALGSVRIAASWAGLLVASSGLVNRRTLNATAISKANACLSVCLQSARLAAFHVWRCFGGASATVGAGKKSVLAHGESNVKLVQSHYNIGGE
jgi:hypothetical protein